MLKNRKDLVLELVRTEFKQKYNDSILGFLWVFLMPFFQFVVLFIVFRYFRGGDKDPDFAAKLMFAIITFGFFREGVMQGGKSLILSSGIISKIYFPRILILNSNLLVSTFSYFINIIIVIIIFGVFGVLKVNLISFLYFLFVSIVLVLLIYVIILFLSILTVIVRDLINITQVILQALFWMSGVFFDLDTVRYSFRILIYLNPMSYIIDSVKKALVYGEVANVYYISLIFVILLVILPFGLWFYRRNVDKVIEFV